MQRRGGPSGRGPQRGGGGGGRMDIASLEYAAQLADEKAANAGGAARRLLAYLIPFRSKLGLILVMVLTSAASQAVGPALIGMATDRFIKPNGDVTGLALTMGGLALVYAVGFFAARSQIALMGEVGQRLLSSIRVDIFQKVQRLPLGFFDKNPAGDLMSRLLNDTEVIQTFVGQALVQVLGSVFSLVGIIVAMLIQSPLLALVSFSVIPIMLIMTRIFSLWARDAYRRTRETIGDVSANLQEEIAGIKVAQAFNRTQAGQQEFARRNALNRKATMSATAITSAFQPLVDVLGTLATAIVAGYGGYLALQGRVSVGVLVAFVAYVQNLFRPLQLLSTAWTQAQASLAASERIFELIDTPIDLQDAPNAQPLPAVNGSVSFENVSFAYDPAKPVLNNVSFTAEPGQTVAIVGPTGAGKTTVISLLARFYDVTAGTVRVDGHDLRTVTQASLRSQMGIVPQDSFLFAGTIADNIRYGRLDATDAEVEAAATAANAHEFIARTKDGYQSKIGERGSGLSQGQRQLIGIARAILAAPRILILDEATSSVDTRTEVLIQSALNTLLKGRTSFVIAHRLSTIRQADVILVLDAGQLIERGTHDELVALNGLYAELYRRQFRYAQN
ncbi:MAG: ABC transporter ATP-binding protein [Chloroflexi bacterium]|nr:ABC transporter ATP-binding protein [Chloroflexota bacterium]